MAGKADARIHLEGDRLFVEGSITYGNTVEVIRAGKESIKAGDVLVDLAGVAQVDSSAVSMLLEWTRTAQVHGRKIEFVNLPGNLADLIELYDVGNMVPVRCPEKSVC